MPSSACRVWQDAAVVGSANSGRICNQEAVSLGRQSGSSRGTALVQDDHSASLRPRGRTVRGSKLESLARGVPNPLSVDVTHGKRSSEPSSKMFWRSEARNPTTPSRIRGRRSDHSQVRSIPSAKCSTAGPVAPDVPLPFMYDI